MLDNWPYYRLFKMTDYWTVFSCILAIVLCFHHYISRSKNARRNKCLNDSKQNLLIVTAHPDDECMFFSPTILGQGEYTDVYLLCMSSGNYYSQGSVRKQELLNSCERLNIPESHVVMIDDKLLPDDPTALWDKSVLSDYILSYVKEFSIDTVITFDDYGVSGHLNHRALYHSLRSLVEHQKLPKGTEAFILESVSVFRKYLSIFDIPLSYISSKNSFISSWTEVNQGQKAMYAHWSQFMWFRVLYILFSRYMVVNTLTPLDAEHFKIK